METREQIEARRGIVRDEMGRIIRSKEWIKARIEHLEAKKEDLMNRIANIDAEIEQRTAELKTAPKQDDVDELLAKAGGDNS